MYLTADVKKKLFKKHGNSESDSGNAESQVALFTLRINHLTNHLKKNAKDFGTQRALVNLVGKRRSQLDYLKNTDIEKYREVIKKLNIRK
ncbi:MAG: 30S ribosomal protein S15 [Bacteroidia bacterium]|nr:30S ribosomal protein S15 [Bacteroidia bacterium]